MPIIQAEQFKGYDFPDDTDYALYLYAEDDFVAANSVPIVAGKFPLKNWRHKFNCTVANKVLSVEAKAVEATTNSDNPLVNWVAALVNQDGERRRFLLKEFRLPHDLGDVVTWEQIRIYNAAAPADLPPDDYYTKPEVDQLFASFYEIDGGNADSEFDDDEIDGGGA